MLETYSNLQVQTLTPEMHAKTCGYWYVVTNSHGPHTAFETYAGLCRFMEERGLNLAAELPKAGTYWNVAINGTYRRQSHMDYNEFFGLDAVLDTKAMDNGDYTLARVTLDDDGIRTIHVMNPNARFRTIYNYSDAAKEMR